MWAVMRRWYLHGKLAGTLCALFHQFQPAGLSPAAQSPCLQGKATRPSGALVALAICSIIMSVCWHVHIRLVAKQQQAMPITHRAR